MKSKSNIHYNTQILSSSIIARFEEIGLTSGIGTPNAMENLVKVMTEEIVTAIHADIKERYFDRLIKLMNSYENKIKIMMVVHCGIDIK